MPKIVSFGDSFIFGSEISDNPDGRRAWPGVAAESLGVDFECEAIRGCGNARILKQILCYFAKNPCRDTLAVINWTWIARMDLMDQYHGPDITLGPTCVPDSLPDPDSISVRSALEFYHSYVEATPNHGLWNSLLCVLIATDFLAKHDIPCVQTYMDHRMFGTNWFGSRLEFYQGYRSPQWPDIITELDYQVLPDWIRQEVDTGYQQGQIPPHIGILQTRLRDHLENFGDLNFLEWSAAKDFEITPSPNLHPLLPAHEAAAAFWLPRYRELL